MTDTLAEAKRAVQLAVSRTTGELPTIPDTDPRGIATIDAARAEAINVLGRPLTSTESFNIDEGRPFDFLPEPVEPIRTPSNAPDEHPEAALKRQAREKARA